MMNDSLGTRIYGDVSVTVYARCVECSAMVDGYCKSRAYIGYSAAEAALAFGKENFLSTGSALVEYMAEIRDED